MIKFNKEQLEAINHSRKACAVIAGAGSGKSSVLVHRIQKLIEGGVKAGDILAITFTRNSSDDLKRKLKNMGIGNVTVGTFHAICMQILMKEGIDTKKLILPWQIENLFKDENSDDIMSFISYQKCYFKTYTDNFEPKDSEYSESELRIFFKEYELFKNKNNLLDMDDMLIKCYEILQGKPTKYTYKFILVDEHQDSNLIQNKLIDILCPSGNVFCVFDYRQAIYTFRGGNPEYCMNFDTQYPDAKIINLDTNYRSKKNIVDNANIFIRNYYGNYKNYSDAISNSKENGNIKLMTHADKHIEAKKIVDKVQELLNKGHKPKEICILYRLNSNSMSIESELKSRDIEYYIENNSSFFKRKEVEAVISYLRLIINPNDNSAFENIFKFRNFPINYLSNDILSDIKTLSGKKNLSYFESFELIKTKAPWQMRKILEFKELIHSLSTQQKKNIPLSVLINNIIEAFRFDEYIDTKYNSDEEIEIRLESLEVLKTFIRSNTAESFVAFATGGGDRKRKTSDKDCVQMMSVHKSKGLEFDTVFVASIEDEKFPHKKSPIDDEARLFYVAATRAKNNLYLSQIYDDNKFINQYFNRE